MPIFNVKDLHLYQGKSATIKRPKVIKVSHASELTANFLMQEIAYFSYDDNHKYHADDRSLRYYYPPRMGADLCKGFDTFRQLDDTADDHLDGLLQRIMELEKETGTKVEADIITWRGMLTKILATPGDWMLWSGYDAFSLSFRHKGTRS